MNELTDFIDEACEAYPVDQDNMFLLGFSQGAILSMTLGLSLGSRVKGVAALSGYIPDFVKREYTIQDVQNVSFFISHGETDHVLPFEWGKENASFLQEQGASVTFQHYPVGHTVSLQNLHDLVNWMKNHIM
ncbi:alpha/beta hydrolase [Salirhabdus sp. Marseille-P4669]|uniref:alpha/beta hydrolase n=1 Tax=Salirhabdus sp. Marseille-P4669 TaxID=2042310 RepID=UPI002100E9DA|nr:dienelactone hydrolase family protein [Salirhabdus sp. Marseille-P4669]